MDAHCTEWQHGCRFRICTRDKDHEKKEVEVTQKIYCLVVDEERKVVHEEEIGNSDSCMDVLKNYCENHDGKFFSIMEFRYEVKQ